MKGERGLERNDAAETQQERMRLTLRGRRALNAGTPAAVAAGCALEGDVAAPAQLTPALWARVARAARTAHGLVKRTEASGQRCGSLRIKP